MTGEQRRPVVGSHLDILREVVDQGSRGKLVHVDDVCTVRIGAFEPGCGNDYMVVDYADGTKSIGYHTHGVDLDAV